MPISRKRLLTTIAAVAAAAAATTTAHAQSIPVKPGLWASATTGTINGRKLPSIFDVKGALTPQQMSSLQSSMAQLGLPAGTPHLACQQSDTFSIPKPASTEECATNVSASDSSSGTVTLTCKGQLNGGGQGTYQVKGKTDATVHWKLEGTAQGMPVKMEQTTVFKWVSDDCSKPPRGLDPSLMELLQ